MNKTVMLILISNRKESATKVQQILTGWGCYIKTRLGLHEDILEQCSDSGLLFLELAGPDAQHAELERKLNLVDGVDARLVELSVE